VQRKNEHFVLSHDIHFMNVKTNHLMIPVTAFTISHTAESVRKIWGKKLQEEITVLSKQRGHRDLIRGGEDVSHLTKTTTPIQSGSLNFFFFQKKKYHSYQ
jgi:hypothetical protein